MAGSNFKLFDENKKNMQTDTEYGSDVQRLQGVQTGVASSKLNNKFAYQVSLVAYAITQMMNANGFNAYDSDSVTTFVNNLSRSVLQKVVDRANAQTIPTVTDKWTSPLVVSALITKFTGASNSNKFVSIEHGGFGKNNPYNSTPSAGGDDVVPVFLGSTIEEYTYKTVEDMQQWLKFDKLEDTMYPVGTIMESTDPNFPSKMKGTWLPCDGRAIDKAKYPELCKVLPNYFNTNSSLKVNGWTDEIMKNFIITNASETNGYYCILGYNYSVGEQPQSSSSSNKYGNPVIVYKATGDDLETPWDCSVLPVNHVSSITATQYSEPDSIAYDVVKNEFVVVGNAQPSTFSGAGKHVGCVWHGSNFDNMVADSTFESVTYDKYLKCATSTPYGVIYIFYSQGDVYSVLEHYGHPTVSSDFMYHSDKKNFKFETMFYDENTQKVYKAYIDNSNEYKLSSFVFDGSVKSSEFIVSYSLSDSYSDVLVTIGNNVKSYFKSYEYSNSYKQPFCLYSLGKGDSRVAISEYTPSYFLANNFSGKIWCKVGDKYVGGTVLFSDGFTDIYKLNIVNENIEFYFTSYQEYPSIYMFSAGDILLISSKKLNGSNYSSLCVPSVFVKKALPIKSGAYIKASLN